MKHFSALVPSVTSYIYAQTLISLFHNATQNEIIYILHSTQPSFFCVLLLTEYHHHSFQRVQSFMRPYLLGSGSMPTTHLKSGRIRKNFTSMWHNIYATSAIFSHPHTTRAGFYQPQKILQVFHFLQVFFYISLLQHNRRIFLQY